VCCTCLDHTHERRHLWWNMKAFKWDPFLRCVLSSLITIVLSPILFVILWLPMLLLILDDDGQTLLKWKGGTFAHLYQKLHPWKVFHYGQIPTTKQFTMVFICWLWKVCPSFCLLCARKKTFSRCSKVHICTFIWILMWCFQLSFLTLFS
jgi:hypothetical protein